MPSKGKFECLRCATCCRNLLESQDGVLRGLPLTGKEAGLFPQALVSPKLGVGINEPREIVLYQVNVKCCPYVNESDECKIYGRRPLMCQSFPIVVGAISNRCKVFSYRKPGVTYAETCDMAIQVAASEKLGEFVAKSLRKHFGKGVRTWEFDLCSKKWIRGQVL